MAAIRWVGRRQVNNLNNGIEANVTAVATQRAEGGERARERGKEPTVVDDHQATEEAVAQ